MDVLNGELPVVHYTVTGVLQSACPGLPTKWNAKVTGDEMCLVGCWLFEDIKFVIIIEQSCGAVYAV